MKEEDLILQCEGEQSATARGSKRRNDRLREMNCDGTWLPELHNGEDMSEDGFDRSLATFGLASVGGLVRRALCRRIAPTRCRSAAISFYESGSLSQCQTSIPKPRPWRRRWLSNQRHERLPHIFIQAPDSGMPDDQHPRERFLRASVEIGAAVPSIVLGQEHVGSPDHMTNMVCRDTVELLGHAS